MPRSVRWTLIMMLVLVNCSALCQEVLAEDTEQNKRDHLWDMAKAVLMFLVVNYHMHYKDGDRWYSGFFMPAFFIMSGLFSKRRGEAYWKNILISNVMNACFFQWLYQKDGLRLWFLIALATYRGLLQPILDTCMHLFGSIAGTCVCFIVSAFFDAALRKIKPDVWHEWFFLDRIQYDRLCFHAMFFTLGFVTDFNALRRLMSQSLVILLGFSLMLVHISFFMFGNHQILGANPFSETSEGGAWLFGTPSTWAVSMLLRSAASFSFFACLVPLADAQSSSLRFLSRILAKSGSRSLYVYCLHNAFLYHGFSVHDQIDEFAQQGLQSPFYQCAHFVLQVLLVLALGSPWVERALRFCVEPAWILSLLAAPVALVKSV